MAHNSYLCLQFLRSASLWHEFQQDWSRDGRWRRLAARREFVDQAMSQEDVQPVLVARQAGMSELLRLVRRLSSLKRSSRDLALETVTCPEALDFALGHGLGDTRFPSSCLAEVGASLTAHFERVVTHLVPLAAFVPSTEVGIGVPQKRRVTWHEIRALARRAFHVWLSDYQDAFAREAWSILEAQGLTSYCDVTSRAEVSVRMLALGDLYRDFCQMVADEVNNQDSWFFVTEAGLEETVLSHRRIAELDGLGICDDAEDDQDTYDDWSERLQALVDGQRRQVYQALLKGYGDSMVLLGSLTITLLRDQEFESSLSYESFEEAIIDVTHMPTYAWVEEGCPVL